MELNARDVDALVEIVAQGQHAALMCVERDHERCHRHLLVQELLEEAGSDLQVYHL